MQREGRGCKETGLGGDKGGTALVRWVARVQGDWLGWRQGRGGLLRWVAGVQGDREGREVLARRLVVEEGG